MLEDKDKAEQQGAEPADQSAPVELDIESLKAALQEEKKKTADYLSGWQRERADYLNYKKRVEQDMAEMTNLANASLILSLLPVIDDLERAFNSVPSGLQALSWIDGMKIIFRKLKSILESRGLTEIQAKGKKFDPKYHEAVMHQEGEDGVVIEELQKGYTMGATVLRPVLVSIGESKKEK